MDQVQTPNPQTNPILQPVPQAVQPTAPVTPAPQAVQPAAPVAPAKEGFFSKFTT